MSQTHETPKPKRTRRKPVTIAAPPIHPFDRLHGTDTGGLIPRTGLLTGHPNDDFITAYYAVAQSILDSLIDRWLSLHPRYAIDRYTFLDVGAGKGRALLAASLHPFHRVTGIELNPAMAAIARANIQAFASSPNASPLAPIDLLEGDALEVPLPVTPTLAFLFHPFEAPVLESFLTRAASHFQAQAKPLDILYVNAEHAREFRYNQAFEELFHGRIPMSPADHIADLAEIASQTEYGSTGDEICGIYRLHLEPRPAPGQLPGRKPRPSP